MLNRSDSPAQDLAGYRRMFRTGRLTIGVFFPIEAFESDRPTMEKQIELAQRAEELGLGALWFRDVPLRDPLFGDVGQIFDPWVYLGYVAAQTHSIALATGSIVLPLRHPLHTAKAAASVDQLSGGRFILGVGLGDRAVEFAAFDEPLETRGSRFRDNFEMLRTALETQFPAYSGSWGAMEGVDLVPKPRAAQIPIFVTGRSQQPLEWIAQQSCGWITYPRALPAQAEVIRGWRTALRDTDSDTGKPFVQSLYIDLERDAGVPPSPIHLGFRLGLNALKAHLLALEEIGVAHVVLNLKYGRRHASQVLEDIGEHIIPIFS